MLRESSRRAGLIGGGNAQLENPEYPRSSSRRTATRRQAEADSFVRSSGKPEHASFTRLEGRELGDPRNGNRGQTAHGSTEQSGRALFPPGPADREQWAAIIGDRPDLAPAVEYEVRGVASRIARGLDFARTDQLRSLGNMVVSQQGALALLALLERGE